MPALQWSESLALGLPYMDDTHREFVDLLASAADAPNDAVLATRLQDHQMRGACADDCRQGNVLVKTDQSAFVLDGQA